MRTSRGAATSLARARLALLRGRGGATALAADREVAEVLAARRRVVRALAAPAPLDRRQEEPRRARTRRRRGQAARGELRLRRRLEAGLGVEAVPVRDVDPLRRALDEAALLEV